MAEREVIQEAVRQDWRARGPGHGQSSRAFERVGFGNCGLLDLRFGSVYPGIS